MARGGQSGDGIGILPKRRARRTSHDSEESSSIWLSCEHSTDNDVAARSVYVASAHGHHNYRIYAFRRPLGSPQPLVTGMTPRTPLCYAPIRIITVGY